MSHRQVIAGRYEIMGTIGQGGMGDVYRGVDRTTGQPVAIKQLNPDIVEAEPGVIERFEREGEALRQLNHPNIVQMLASLEEDEMHYLVMEYVSGGSLRVLIDREGALPIRRAMEIALDVADALTRAHRLNIIHRDIKPDNVLLAEDGTPRLTDFGVARLGNRTRMTETGSVIGTFAYLSPEGCRSEDCLVLRRDVVRDVDRTAAVRAQAGRRDGLRDHQRTNAGLGRVPARCAACARRFGQADAGERPRPAYPQRAAGGGRTRRNHARD
jgi:serine/threonine protein kinase